MPTRPAPRPTEYNLPESFRLDDYDRDKQSAAEHARRRALPIAMILVIAVILAIWGYGLVVAGWSTGSLGTIPALIVIWVMLGVYVFERARTYFTPSVFKGERENAVSRYRLALHHWRESEFETGLDFWRVKRGVEFEIALRKMLEKRGCNVRMTKGSGDGGVDLIIQGWGSTQILWCQCKAHAKPVGVTPVRELAGVCSRNTAKPVFFAVNGYTKAARSTADNLGVKLFDATDIAAIARRQTLSNSKSVN